MNKEKALQLFKQLIDKTIEHGGIFKNIEDVMILTQAFQFLAQEEKNTMPAFKQEDIVKKQDIK